MSEQTTGKPLQMGSWHAKQQGMNSSQNVEMPELPQEAPSEIQDQDGAISEQLEDTVSVQDIQEVDSPQIPKEDVHERNYKAMRSEINRLQRENERLSRTHQQEPSKYAHDEPEEEDIRSDDIVEGKHLRKYKDKLTNLERRLEESNIERRLQSKFIDFDRVVNESNVNILKAEYPELYSTIATSSDLYNKGASAYTLIKKLGIGVVSEQDAERQLVMRNSSKPKPVTSISAQRGNTPLSQANAFANGLTPELQAQLIKEMSESRKKY